MSIKKANKSNHGLESHHKLNFAIATLNSMKDDVEAMRQKADPMERLSLALIVESYQEAITILDTHRELSRREQKELKEEK